MRSLSVVFRPGFDGNVVGVFQRERFWNRRQNGIGFIPVVCVTSNAVFVQNGLNFPPEREAAIRPVKRRDFRRWPVPGNRSLSNWSEVVVLMASDARHDFPRHGGKPRSHQLQRRAVLVQRLKRYRDVGGNGEMRRPVRLNRNGSQNGADVPRTVQADSVNLSAHSVIRIIIRENSQLFDFPVTNSLQPGTGVDVSQKDGCGLTFRIGSVDNCRRNRRFL